MNDALTLDYPLEAHLLWRTFVQYRAEAQPVFRRFRNYDARSDDLKPARRGARRRAAQTPARARLIVKLTTD